MSQVAVAAKNTHKAMQPRTECVCVCCHEENLKLKQTCWILAHLYSANMRGLWELCAKNEYVCSMIFVF